MGKRAGVTGVVGSVPPIVVTRARTFVLALALAPALALALAMVPARAFAVLLQVPAGDAGGGGVAAEAASDTASDGDLSQAMVVGLKQEYEFRGKPVKPSVQVMVERTTEVDNGDGTATFTQVLYVLEEGRDYAVSYRGAGAIGTARLVVKGVGAFRGTLTETYAIVPARARLVAVNPGRGKLSVRATKVKGGCSYQFAYKTDGKAWKRVSGRQAKRTLANLKRGQSYTVKVRAYKIVNGVRCYGKWSKPEVMTTKPWRIMRDM